MEKLQVVVALTTRENDYQAEQATAVTEMAQLGSASRSRSFTPITTRSTKPPATRQNHSGPDTTAHRDSRRAGRDWDAPRSPKLRSRAGIGWGIINSDPDYIAELRRGGAVPGSSPSARTSPKSAGFRGTSWLPSFLRGMSSTSKVPSTAWQPNFAPRECFPPSPRRRTENAHGDWTERSAHNAVKSWLSLGSSRQLQIRGSHLPERCYGDGRKKGFRRSDRKRIESSG